MGAKTQANAKDTNEKRPAIKCDDCGKDFLTISALKSHTTAKHPEKHKQTLSNEAETKDEKKTAFVPPTSRMSKRLQQKKSTDKEVVTTQSSRKTVFQCPKCMKEFGVFFPALRHIQNRHCEDKDGNPVSAESPDLIQPIRKEICMECDKMHNASQPCDALSERPESGTYCCLACKQIFKSVADFDEHVEAKHDDSVNVVIMENMNEFLNWKNKVEAKQRVKYLTLSNTTQKQYYQCNYVSPQNSALVTHLCPAVIIVREFSKGIHVRYHKEHYEHTCETYTHQPSDNKKAILDHSEVFDNLVKSGADVYNKLKDLMKTIAQRASTLKKKKLKPLYISALEMQSYLNSVESESDNGKEPTVPKKNAIPNSVAITKNLSNDTGAGKIENAELKPKKTMTDDQIVKALEGTRASARLKRKSESTPMPEPKKKVLKKSETKTDTKENNSDFNLDLACSERFESPKPSIPSSFTHSPSFNDSYKKFINSTSPKAYKPRRVKKDVVKTKMGQFSPSPKQTTPANVEPDVASIKKKKTPTKSTPVKDLKFSDVKYEVIEQENDCNILILKI